MVGAASCYDVLQAHNPVPVCVLHVARYPKRSANARKGSGGSLCLGVRSVSGVITAVVLVLVVMVLTELIS